jgi:hypothetical protein
MSQLFGSSGYMVYYMSPRWVHIRVPQRIAGTNHDDIDMSAERHIGGSRPNKSLQATAAAPASCD